MQYSTRYDTVSQLSFLIFITAPFLPPFLPFFLPLFFLSPSLQPSLASFLSSSLSPFHHPSLPSFLLPSSLPSTIPHFLPFFLPLSLPPSLTSFLSSSLNPLPHSLLPIFSFPYSTGTPGFSPAPSPLSSALSSPREGFLNSDNLSGARYPGVLGTLRYLLKPLHSILFIVHQAMTIVQCVIMIFLQSLFYCYFFSCLSITNQQHTFIIHFIYIISTITSHSYYLNIV